MVDPNGLEEIDANFALFLSTVTGWSHSEISKAHIHGGLLGDAVTSAVGRPGFSWFRGAYLSPYSSTQFEEGKIRGYSIAAEEVLHTVQWYQHSDGLYDESGPPWFLAFYASEYIQGRAEGQSHIAAGNDISYELEARGLAGVVSMVLSDLPGVLRSLVAGEELSKGDLEKIKEMIQRYADNGQLPDGIEYENGVLKYTVAY
jgi:hypothetical protein